MTTIGGPGSRLYEMERQAKLEPELGPLTKLALDPPKPEHYCAHCREHIPRQSSYFQEVPGIGDLCLECHKEWVEQETDNG